MKNWDCKIDCCIYECSRKITETWPANQAKLRSVWMWIMTGDIKLRRAQFVLEFRMYGTFCVPYKMSEEKVTAKEIENCHFSSSWISSAIIYYPVLNEKVYDEQLEKSWKVITHRNHFSHLPRSHSWNFSLANIYYPVFIAWDGLFLVLHLNCT